MVTAAAGEGGLVAALELPTAVSVDAILAELGRLLAGRGVALLEIGQGQEWRLGPLAAAQGFAVAAHLDLAGIIRCLELRTA